MNNALQGWNDTIVALATPNGMGAIGVIRLSGSQAIEIANTLFPSKNLLQQPSHTLHVGLLKNEEMVLDEVVIALYKAPKSYTGENVVEISCHGANYIQQQIIETLASKGARPAKAGEFTQRAFINGKLDLTQAEAVADLIASNTEASKKTALHNIKGGFSKVLKQLRDELISFSALIELELDFSQEDVTFADKKQLYILLQKAQKTVSELIDSFQLGNVIKQGVSVAIIGKPNAGKSTLLNQLLNEERAIVSAIAGTTRDTVEETLNIKGILFRLIDTAGIRQHTTDEIEKIGVEKSLEKIQTADIILHLFDYTDANLNEVIAQQKSLETLNKTVITLANKTENILEATNIIINQFFPNALFMSAKNGVGITALKNTLYNAVMQPNSIGNEVIVTNARHVAALQKIREGITDILEGLNNEVPGDLLALDIRRCLHFLGEITGQVTNEDQLDYIFSKFCIGK